MCTCTQYCIFMFLTYSDSQEVSFREIDFLVGIPSQKSWGRKKAAFYDADIVEEYAG